MRGDRIAVDTFLTDADRLHMALSLRDPCDQYAPRSVWHREDAVYRPETGSHRPLHELFPQYYVAGS